MPLHVVGISGNRVWHTVRIARAFAPWDDVFNSAGQLPFPPSDISCGFAGGALQVCVAGGEGRLFHTIRNARGSWQSWGNAEAAAFSVVSGITSVDSVGIGGGLHVCVEGSLQTRLSAEPSVWRGVRISTPPSWFPSAEITGRYKPILDLACASVAVDQLHILVRCTDDTGTEVLMHNIRFRTGGQQPAGDQDVFRQFPNAAALRSTQTVAAAGIGPALHVVASDGTDLFHTIRLNDAAWQTTFGLVRPAVTPSFRGPLGFPSCANESGNLHICAISAGDIMHTIRLSSPAAWQNPETGPNVGFGSVLSAVPPGPAVPPRAFTRVACAGE